MRASKAAPPPRLLLQPQPFTLRARPTGRIALVLALLILCSLTLSLPILHRLSASLPGAPISTPSPISFALDVASSGLPLPPATLTLVFATYSSRHMLRNWLVHARKVTSLPPHGALALDEAVHTLCKEWGARVISASRLLQPFPDASHALARLGGEGSRENVRNEPASFKLLGFVKLTLALRFVEAGYSVLLSDADSVWLADPSPWIGGAQGMAEDAGLLPSADLLVTNDLPDPRRDGQPDSVFNTGALFLRASARTLAFLSEWSNRTRYTAEIGNDQTELNRLLRSRYADGDFKCSSPSCLLPDERIFVPVAAAFTGGACPRAEKVLARIRQKMETPGHTNESNSAECGCSWGPAPLSSRDAYTGLAVVSLVQAHADWNACNKLLLERGLQPAHPARRIYWMWGGRLRVGVLPMERFLQGHTFFIQRLHELRGVAPVHVHVTYTLGVNYGKVWRLRTAGLWDESNTSYFTDGNFVHIFGVEDLLQRLLDRMGLPDKVWECEAVGQVRGGTRPASLPDRPSQFFGGQRTACFHPKHLVTPSPDMQKTNLITSIDPAAPHIAVQYLLRIIIRNLFALASSLGRRAVLPRLWSLCERHWWQLRDCRVPGVEYSVPMPFESPLDNALDVSPAGLGGLQVVDFVDASFLSHPHVSSIRHNSETLHLQLSSGNLNSQGKFALPAGITFDGGGKILRSRWHARGRVPRLLEVPASSILRFSACGFDDVTAGEAFATQVIHKVFSGQYSYCSEERNPFVDALVREARSSKSSNLSIESLLLTRRNCTGQPGNAFNKPKVDLGPSTLSFLPPHVCSSKLRIEDDTELTINASLALVGLPFTTQPRPA